MVLPPPSGATVTSEGRQVTFGEAMWIRVPSADQDASTPFPSLRALEPSAAVTQTYPYGAQGSGLRKNRRDPVGGDGDGAADASAGAAVGLEAGVGGATGEAVVDGSADLAVGIGAGIAETTGAAVLEGGGGDEIGPELGDGIGLGDAQAARSNAAATRHMAPPADRPRPLTAN